MVVEIKATIQNSLSGTDKNNKHQTKEQVATMKSNLPEVTFCNVSDNTSSSFGTLCDQFKGSGCGGGSGTKQRKRLISNESESADSITSSTDKKKPQIPDGGFGWVIVFASLCISLIADGVSFSFGLLYTELLAYFRESKSKTAWIGSLFLAVPLMSGPIMSNLVDKYGCRKMTIIGGIISSGGFALASLCHSIEMLYITFGLISGLGLGIGYVTAVVSIAFWFDKNRTFATGIGASGTGIGTFLYAPFTQWLIENFGWRGATLIMAGTMLNTCVFGCLMRDPDWLIEENRLESRSQSVTTFSNSSVCLDEIKKLLENGATKEAVLDTLVTNYNTEANQQILDPSETKASKKYNSELFLPTYLAVQDLDSFTGIRHESRRSLRRKDDAEILSRENLLTLSTATKSSPAKKHHIASVETLSPSEKISTAPNTPLKSSFGGSLASSSSFDEDYLTGKFTNDLNINEGLHGSRRSLNENIINKLNGDKIEEFRKSFRGNSLDILYEGVPLEKIIDDIINKKPNNIANGNAVPIIQTELTNGDISAGGGGGGKNKNALRRQSQPQNQHHHQQLTLRNSNYLKNMRVHRNSIHYRGALLNTHRYRLRASSCPNIYRNSMTTIARESEEKWYDSFVDIMKSIFDFSLFLDPKFALFNMSTLLLFIWFIIPYFYVTEHMLNYDYTEEDGAILIAIIGIFNTIGMVSLGFIGDQPWLNVSKTYAVCLLLCGLSVALMPIVVESYTCLCCLAVVFGITFASSFSFTPSILVSLVDLDDFTCAYGLVLLVQGVGNLIGPPLAGILFEINQRWDDSFYAAGFFIAVSGVLAYAVAVLEDLDKKRESERDNDCDVEA